MFSRSLDNISNRRSSLAFGIFAVFLIHETGGQIYHPGENETIAIQRINGSSESTISPTTATTTDTTVTRAKIAGTIPAKPEIKCPQNMQLENEINSTEVFCECAAGYLYHRKLDSCFKQYTRGPCTEGKLFILKTNATMARCVHNPCPDANTIMYKDSCHKLSNPGEPCEHDEILTIPDNSNEPGCVSIFIDYYQIITGRPRRCSPGTRRAGRGKCRRVIS